MTDKKSGRPIVGLTIDSEAPGEYSKFPWYALRENYAGAVARAGGLAMLLPHEAGFDAPPDADARCLRSRRGLH